MSGVRVALLLSQHGPRMPIPAALLKPPALYDGRPPLMSAMRCTKPTCSALHVTPSGPSASSRSRLVFIPVPLGRTDSEDMSEVGAAMHTQRSVAQGDSNRNM